MSFFINNNNQNRPGPISGNSIQGLCEKVLIEVDKVFDACVTQTTETGLVLTATNFNPANPTLPLTFVSAETATGATPIISNLVITRLENKPNFANVSGTITIPVTITYTDANNNVGTASSTFTKNFNTILFVPQPSLSPVTVTATAVFGSTSGTFTTPNLFTITGCLRVIIKVIATVDILVPSYGYPCIPTCQSIPEAQCPGVGDTPIYPTAL